MKQVLVIGAGVCGLTCAVQIAEFYNHRVKVTLVADKFSPETTGDGSAGLWSPYLCNADKKVLAWSDGTHKFFMDLWQRSLAAEVGLCLLPMVRLTSESGYETADWMGIPFGGTRLTDRQLELISRDGKKKYTGGIHFVSFTCDVTRLLPYLMRRFKNAGGIVKQAKIDKLSSVGEFGEFDVIVNCTGLGAKELIAGELDVHPIRGQVNRVSAPWLYQVILDDDDDGNYLIPNSESVILGGTHQYNDFNLKVSEDDDKFIMEGCQKLIPGIKHAPLIKQWVGLRPGRSTIRLETELMDNGLHIIHNYGHGGSGVTMSWGCATSVLGELQQIFGDLLSKL